MEWIEKAKGIIGRLRRNGKTESEIEEIVQQAADKATVTQEMERSQAEVATMFKAPSELLASPEFEQQYLFFAKAAGEAMRRIIDKIREEGMTMKQVEAVLWMMYGSKQQVSSEYEWKWIIPSSRQLASNNWRKLHGVPMRRKGRKRHGRTGRGCGNQ